MKKKGGDGGGTAGKGGKAGRRMRKCRNKRKTGEREKRKTGDIMRYEKERKSRTKSGAPSFPTPNTSASRVGNLDAPHPSRIKHKICR